MNEERRTLSEERGTVRQRSAFLVQRWGRTAVLLALSLAGLAVLGASVQVYAYAQRDETRPADAAIVLGAAVFGARPSPVLRERLNHAIALYKAGTVQVLIFTGGQGDPDEATEADVAAAYALTQGVPQEAILRETTSTNTVENLTSAWQIAADNGLDTFLIVSTPFHMKRAMAIAADLGMEAYSSPTRSIQWISGWTKARAFLQEVGSYLFYEVGSVVRAF